MKATITILAAVLTLQAGILFAGNDFPPLTPNNDASASCCVLLVPISPAVATFDEIVTLSDFVTLAPVTPNEVDFSDVVPETNFNLTDLAPVTPAFADFDDAVVVNSFDNGILAPATPAEADFE